MSDVHSDDECMAMISASYRNDHYPTCPTRCRGECTDYLPASMPPGPPARVYRARGYVTRGDPTPPPRSAPQRPPRGADVLVEHLEVDGVVTVPFRPALAGFPAVRGGLRLEAVIVRGVTFPNYHVRTTCACGASRVIPVWMWRSAPLPNCRMCPETKKLRSEHIGVPQGTPDSTWANTYLPRNRQ